MGGFPLFNVETRNQQGCCERQINCLSAMSAWSIQWPMVSSHSQWSCREVVIREAASTSDGVTEVETTYLATAFA